MVFFASIGHVLTSVSGSLDTGSFWYWRIHSIVVGGFYLIQIPLDLVLCPHINSYSYFVEHFSKEQILEITSKYYSREVAEEKINEFLEEKRALQNIKNLKNVEEGEKKGSYLEEYLQDIISQKEAVIHIIIFAVLAMFGFRNMLANFQIIFSSKGYQLQDLTKPAKVMSSVTLLIASMMTLVTSIFRLNKRRRFAFISSHTTTVMGLILLSICYYFKQVQYAMFSILLANISYPIYWPTLLVYMNDICDSRTLFFCPLFMSVMDFCLNYFVGNFFDFENDSYERLSFKFGIFALVGVASNLGLRCMMLETDEKSRVEIIKELRGEAMDLGGKKMPGKDGVRAAVKICGGLEDGEDDENKALLMITTRVKSVE